jgi:hypothetical protein
MSERAQNLYAEIMASQSLIIWNQQQVEAKRFGYEQVSSMLNSFLPAVEKGFLLDFTTLNYLVPKRPYHCPYSVKDDKDTQYIQGEALRPLYTYSRRDEKTGKVTQEPINVNSLNVPLVCAAREQYLERLGKEVRPLFNHSPHTKTSWMLDIKITSDIFLSNLHRPLIKGSWMLDPTMERTRNLLKDFTHQEWYETPPLVDMPMYLPMFKGKTFALSTKDEFFTFGKVKARDPDWDLKDPLVAEPSSPETIPATFARIEKLNSLLVLVDRLNPRHLFTRDYVMDSKASYLQKKDESVLSRDILRHIKDFKKYDSSVRALLLTKRGIFPGFPGI